MEGSGDEFDDMKWSDIGDDDEDIMNEKMEVNVTVEDEVAGGSFDDDNNELNNTGTSYWSEKLTSLHIPWVQLLPSPFHIWQFPFVFHKCSNGNNSK